jgi:hypothetical protein
MLHSMLDALREGLAAQREYVRLTSKGMGHDRALSAALSETSRSRQASARGISIQSVFLILVAAVGARIDRKVLQGRAGLSRFLIGMKSFQ